jgi:hypothetical protein
VARSLKEVENFLNDDIKMSGKLFRFPRTARYYSTADSQQERETKRKTRRTFISNLWSGLRDKHMQDANDHGFWNDVKINTILLTRSTDIEREIVKDIDML